MTLDEYRCRHCNHLLFKGLLRDATIEVKCTNGRCRAFNTFEYHLAKEPLVV